jgi:hypothetical protein
VCGNMHQEAIGAYVAPEPYKVDTRYMCSNILVSASHRGTRSPPVRRPLTVMAWS